jgi:hypothetical protein
MAREKSSHNQQKEDEEKPEKVNDVFFDKKKGKLVVKDNPVTLRDQKQIKKPSQQKSNDFEFDAPMDRNKFLKMKRVNNVAKDKFDDDDVDYDKVKKAKRKLDDNHSEMVNRGKRRETHILKFSGDEYKNKVGKGDKLVSGKYEPFAYIQLNPKTTSQRRRTDALKLFEGVMHPEKKNK